MRRHHVVRVYVLRSLAGDNPGSNTKAAASECLWCNQCHVEKLSHCSHVLNLMSRLHVPWCVFFFFFWHLKLERAAVLRDHSVCSDLLLLHSDRDSCEATHSNSNPPYTHTQNICLPCSPPPPLAFEDTRLCNRKDNPPLWSARSGFFLMFIFNNGLFSYRSFTFSVSTGHIYFFR